MYRWWPLWSMTISHKSMNNRWHSHSPSIISPSSMAVHSIDKRGHTLHILTFYWHGRGLFGIRKWIWSACILALKRRVKESHVPCSSNWDFAPRLSHVHVEAQRERYSGASKESSRAHETAAASETRGEWEAHCEVDGLNSRGLT